MALVTGFLGLGNMGRPMACSVARAGFPLWVYNRTRQKAEALAHDIAAQVGDSPAQIADQCDVILTMVSDASALEQLYFGRDGIMDGLRPATVCVEMSTVGPAAVRELGDSVSAGGARLLDAPVSGSIALADAGQLTMMVGGAEEDLDRVRSVLSAIASLVFHVGPLGAGATMKLAVNAVVYGLNHALSEGLVLAECAGVDRETAYHIFEHSAIAAPFVQYRKEAFLKPRCTPVGFSLRLAEKDLELIEELAREVHAATPQLAVNHRSVEAAMDDGRADDDVSAIAEYLRDVARDSCED